MSEKGRIFGYARVSSVGQNLDRQMEALKRYVEVENIVTDKKSGKNLDREGYQALKGALGLRSGDTLYIKSLDRLSRNKQEMQEELRWMKENGITLRIIDLPTTMIDFGDGQDWIREMVSNILIEVISTISEEERHMIRKRQREGIDAAKAKGKKFGRPEKGYPEDWDILYARYRKGELTRKYVIKQLDINVDRFKYLAKKYEREKAEKDYGNL